MRTRLELHEKLCQVLGSNHVYFCPPAKGLKYPCIIYDLESIDPMYADNIPYLRLKRWSIILIDQNPDSEIPSRLDEIRYCRFNRLYQADGMNHFVYDLYF